LRLSSIATPPFYAHPDTMMTIRLRNYVVGSAALLAMAGVAGCRGKTATNDGPKDILAVDTTIDLGFARPNQNVEPDPELKTLAAATKVAPVGAAKAAPVATAGNDARKATGLKAATRSRVAATRRAVESTPTVRVASRSTRRPIRTVSNTSDRATTTSENVEIPATPTSSSPRLTFAAGSLLSLASGKRVCTNTSHVGDRFDARLAEPIVANNGTVIPSGAAAVAAVASLNDGDSLGSESPIGLRIVSVTFQGVTYPVVSRVTDAEVVKVRSRSAAGTARTAAASAAVGGLLGHVLGRNTKSTVIGAVGGGVAGAVIANRTASSQACVPKGGLITAQLVEPLRIEAAG
jgi:hypothetical protein